MAEMTATTPVSDVMLARYVAGDLHGDQLARVERAIGEIPGLAERLERMKSERAAFLASTPPHQFAHQVVTRLTVERPGPAKWQVWWLLPPVTVATALLLGVVYQRALGPQSLSRPAVTTDETYQLPEEAAAPAPATDRVPPVPEALAKADPASTETKPEPKRSAAKVAADKPAEDGKKLAQEREADNARLARDGRKNAGKGAGALGDTNDGLRGAGGGEGAARGNDALREKSAQRQQGYAQPPATTSTTPSEPAPAKPASPPVWASPPPPAPVEHQQERRGAAPADEKPARPSAANKAPAQSAPAPAPTPAPRAEPSGAASGPSVAASEAPAKGAKAEEKEKARSRASESDDLDTGTSAKDDRADAVATTVSITREQGGRAHALGAGDIVPGGTLLKVTAQGGKHVTVIGVRRDGVPHVYAQAESTGGQPVNLALRLRPASARISEALFVVVGDAPLVVPREQVSGGKDAAQLPLRLALPGNQRRFVVTVSAAAE